VKQVLKGIVYCAPKYSCHSSLCSCGKPCQTLSFGWDASD